MRAPSYLRISVTSRCNLRCIYCRDDGSATAGSSGASLSAEQIIRFARFAAMCGVKKVRLTGGEPLLHDEIVEIARRLRSIEGIRTIGLTTNGVLLKALAAPLRAAGLSSVNMSLPSLRRDVFARATGGGKLDDALAGLETLLRERYSPIKLNVVVMRDVNLDEVPSLARLAQSEPVEVRFIEFMPFTKLRTDQCVSNNDVFERFKEVGRLRSLGNVPRSSAARLYSVEGFRGRIGFISPMSHPFCANCDRLRLTADGKLRACLVEGGEVDARHILNDGLGVEAMREIIARAMSMKPACHRRSFTGDMSCIGG